MSSLRVLRSPYVGVGKHYQQIGKSASKSRLGQNVDGQEVPDESESRRDHHEVVEDDDKSVVKSLAVDVTFEALSVVSDCLALGLYYKSQIGNIKECRAPWN